MEKFRVKTLDDGGLVAGALVQYAWFNTAIRQWCAMAGTVVRVEGDKVLVALYGGQRWVSRDEVEAY